MGFLAKHGADAFAAHCVFESLIVPEWIEGELSEQGEILGGLATARIGEVFERFHVGTKSSGILFIAGLSASHPARLNQTGV